MMGAMLAAGRAQGLGTCGRFSSEVCLKLLRPDYPFIGEEYFLCVGMDRQGVN
jgi:hypothetical protein